MMVVVKMIWQDIDWNGCSTDNNDYDENFWDGDRVKCPVSIHFASSPPLFTKNLPVLDLELLETCMMA